MSMRQQETIRQLFQAKLRELNLHQKTLAPVLGRTPSAITRKMKGETPFNEEEIRKISRFLNIPELFHYPVLDRDLHLTTPPYDPVAKVLHDGIILLPSRDKNEIVSFMAFVFECKLPHSNIGPILRALASQAS